MNSEPEASVLMFTEALQSSATIIAYAMLHFLWQGTLAGLLLWAVLRCLRDRVSDDGIIHSLAAIRYHASLVVLASLPLMVVGSVWFICHSADERQSPGPQFVMAEDTGSASMSETQSSVEPLSLLNESTVASGDGREAVSDLNEINSVQSNNHRNIPPDKTTAWLLLGDWLSLVWLDRLMVQYAGFFALAYLVGATSMLVRLASGYYQTWRWRRLMIPVTDVTVLGMVRRHCQSLGIRVAPVVATCDRVVVPMVLGVIRPVILLPISFASGLSADQLSAILRHELAHIRRLDPVFNLLQRMIEALLFFHPATWWISRQVRTEREHCCDDLVSTAIGSASYVDALLQMAEHATLGPNTPRNATAQGVAADGRSRSGLALRIHRLLGDPDRLSLGWTQSGLAVFMALGLLTAAVTVSQGATERQDDWIRGTGEDLAFRIHGEVFYHEGRPASDFAVVLTVQNGLDQQIFDATVEGHRFYAWIPAKDLGWALRVECQSADGIRRASQVIDQTGFRAAAQDGLRLHLNPLELGIGERLLPVRVMHSGLPVENAWLEVVTSKQSTTLRTGPEGVATVRLAAGEILYWFTTWTQDGGIGGYQFSRGPTRDPNLESYDVELYNCRPLQIRLINADDGSPVSNCRFEINVATPAPYFNYVGQNRYFQMVSDDSGQSTFEYWPDWESHHAYLEIKDTNWVIADEANAFPVDKDLMTVRLRRSSDHKRQWVRGRLDLPPGILGGFAVLLTASRSETPLQFERLVVYSDRDGNYSALLRPQAKYAACVFDNDWVSEFQTFTPAGSDLERESLPGLTVVEGTPVEIRVTAGPSQNPLAHEQVSVLAEFEYQFQDGDSMARGVTHRQVFAQTDSAGVARFRVPVGPVRAMCTVQGWQGMATGTATSDETLRLHLHRETAEKTPVEIRVQNPVGGKADLEDCDVFIRSLDPTSREQFTLKTDASGSCQLEADAKRVAVMVRTRDHQYAAARAVEIRPEPIEVTLTPARRIVGSIVDPEQNPQPNVRLQARVALRDSREPNASVTFDVLSTVTDDEGRFAFAGLPENCEVVLQGTISLNSQLTSLNRKVYLFPGEDRVLDPFVIGASKVRSEMDSSLEARFAAMIRLARLSDCHLILIGVPHDLESQEIVKIAFMDYRRNPDCGQFMQLMAQFRTEVDETATFWESRSLAHPEQGQIQAVAYDGGGQILEQISVRVDDANFMPLVDAFMLRTRPPQQDAGQKWTAAFAEAKRSNRKVWVRISQRYCQPCHLLSKWLDDHRALLERDYVLVKVDDVRDLGGGEIFQRLANNEVVGVPFFAIYDQDENLVVDSKGPLGNIGFPGSYEGRRHLETMLKRTRTSLSDEEISGLLRTLEPQ